MKGGNPSPTGIHIVNRHHNTRMHETHTRAMISEQLNQ